MTRERRVRRGDGTLQEGDARGVEGTQENGNRKTGIVLQVPTCPTTLLPCPWDSCRASRAFLPTARVLCDFKNPRLGNSRLILGVHR